MKQSFVDTRHGKIHCLSAENQSEVTLIFLHGIGSNTKAWKRTVGFIPDRFNILIVDFLGHGLSDAPRIEYSMDVQVECLEDVINAMKLKDYVFIGNSYGGWASCKYSINSTGKPMCIVLEDSAGLKREIDDMQQNGTLDQDMERVKHSALMVSGNKEYVIDSILHSRNSLLSDKDLSMITVPTLIIWGAEDEVINPKYAKVFNSYITGSELSIIEGAGHTSHFSHAEQFMNLVIGFVDKVEESK